jgi:hypothetical protein
VLLAACSTAGKPAGSPSTAAPAVTAPAVTATAAASPSQPATTSGLAGTWAGHYGGAYSGTFRLNWNQTGSALSGMITLSSFSQPLAIHGTVNGGAIRFGTVGSSTHITYTGSVSGNSMSGNWQITLANGTSGGTWSASRS